MNIQLHFLSEDKAPGVKMGGVVSHNLTEIEVRCLPADLPTFIEVDITELEMDAAIHLSQITLPKGVELTANIEEADGDTLVVSIHRPRVEVEEEEVKPEGEEAEGEGEAGEKAEKPEE